MCTAFELGVATENMSCFHNVDSAQQDADVVVFFIFFLHCSEYSSGSKTSECSSEMSSLASSLMSIGSTFTHKKVKVHRKVKRLFSSDGQNVQEQEEKDEEETEASG